MPSLQPGQEVKASTIDFLAWDSTPDAPEFQRARMYYDWITDSVIAINSDGDEIFNSTVGTGVSLTPLTDQTIAGPFDLILSGGNLVAQLLQAQNVFLFADLPTASSVNRGMTAQISDSNTTTWGANISGGGGSLVLAYCNGTNWTVIGK